MAAVAERLSADAYLAREDPRRTELLDGGIVVNEPTFLHQQTVGRIYAALPARRRACPARPDLVVEVRSAGTWAQDLGPKRRLYERHGVRDLWLVDTAARSVLVFARPPGAAAFTDPVEVAAQDSLTSALLPGFAASVAALIPG